MPRRQEKQLSRAPLHSSPVLELDRFELTLQLQDPAGVAAAALSPWKRMKMVPVLPLTWAWCCWYWQCGQVMAEQHGCALKRLLHGPEM